MQRVNKIKIKVMQCGGTSISWRTVKQTITTTLSNHAELLALHEGKSRIVVYLLEQLMQQSFVMIILKALLR
jgi:hypothetical protein